MLKSEKLLTTAADKSTVVSRFFFQTVRRIIIAHKTDFVFFTVVLFFFRVNIPDGQVARWKTGISDAIDDAVAQNVAVHRDRTVAV